jgi:hypothetical protein
VSGLAVFYHLGEITQCPLFIDGNPLIEWPGHVDTANLGSLIRPLLNRGFVVEFNRPGAKIWGVS